jgi:hypothetical protein
MQVQEVRRGPRVDGGLGWLDPGAFYGPKAGRIWTIP